MKRGNLDRWDNIPECTNLLLFSQLVNELLFDYSIPSNRVSTLNSHYLCIDALSAINNIENNGVPEGSLKPIMEELYSALKKDPVFVNYDNSPLDYFVKYQGEKYVITSKMSDLNYGDSKKIIFSLDTCFFSENNYYNSLKKSIIKIVEDNDIKHQKNLFRMVKSLLTELMNSGYTLRYIYEVMNRYYWNPMNDIISPSAINLFFEAFDFKEKEYTVVFVVNKNRIKKFVSFIDGLDLDDDLQPRFGLHGEKQFFNKKNREGFLCIKKKSLDPFKAANRAKEILKDNAALYRLYDHNYRYDINTVSCGVYDDHYFYKVGQRISAVEHTKTLSTKQISEGMEIFDKVFQSIEHNRAYDDLLAILHAARFHSHSLDSSSEENQLLDLWSIFETVLDISNKHTSDRIQQVCMYLVPILKRKYIYSLFEQLTMDVKNYNNEQFEKIFSGCKTTEEMVQKMCEFTLLEIYADDRACFIEGCCDFPLIKERIEYYSSILCDTCAVYRFVEKHAECVKWQIMRIYRNRNLIIHNGQSMPYLNLLIENLHSYVDDFLSYAIHSLAKGHDIESMCQELFIKECKWNATFQKKNRPLDSELIENMLSL